MKEEGFLVGAMWHRDRLKSMLGEHSPVEIIPLQRGNRLFRTVAYQ